MNHQPPQMPCTSIYMCFAADCYQLTVPSITLAASLLGGVQTVALQNHIWTPWSWLLTQEPQGSGSGVTGMSFKLSQNEPQELYTQSRLSSSEFISLLLSVPCHKEQGHDTPSSVVLICQFTLVASAQGTATTY